MAKNIIVISVDIRETRVALIEDGIIAELHIERRGHPSSGTVGNVVLGKVTRVLPGLQAAFIDVGQERAAFLHVEDLIRPDDFETYLAGGRKHAMDEDGPRPTRTSTKSPGGAPAPPPPAADAHGRAVARRRGRASAKCRPRPRRSPKRRTTGTTSDADDASRARASARRRGATTPGRTAIRRQP